MKFYRVWLLLLLCLSGAVPAVYGQAEPSFNIRFKTYPLGTGDFTGLYYRDVAGEMQPVNFLRNRGIRSRAHRYAGESPLRFYRMQTNAEGAEVPVEVASVPLDNSSKDVLLMFASRGDKDAAAGREFHVFKMNDDVQRFPAGNVLFFNAYPDTLYIAFGKERIQIQPGQFSGPYSLPKSTTGAVPISMLKLGADGQPVDLLRNRWRFSEGTRELIILANDGKSEMPAVYQLSEEL